MADTRRRFLKFLGLGAITPAIGGPVAVVPVTSPMPACVIEIDAYTIPVKFRTHDALWLEAARHHALKNDNAKAVI